MLTKVEPPVESMYNHRLMTDEASEKPTSGAWTTRRFSGANEHSAAAQRSERILQELLRAGEVAVEELAKQLDVSASTIRRDLTVLERRGLLRRTHGGAAPVGPSLYEPFRLVSSFQEQEQRRTPEKRRIGLAAAELVADGEMIAISAGTTTTQVARSLRHRQGITVITNTINIAMELSHSDGVKVFVTSGFLSGDWFALIGPWAVQSVDEFFVDKAFIGVDGIHAEHGLTTNYPDQAAIHHAMMRQARRRIVVADHRKLGVVGTARIWPATDVDLLITDKGASDEAIAPFLAMQIEVLRV
jgi:DeoR family transcriptional regulator of aga operon